MSRQTKEQVQYLLLRFLEAKATAQEELQLFQILQQETADNEWEPLLEELIEAEPGLQTYSPEEWQPVIDNILKKASGEKQVASGVEVPTPVHKINTWKSNWKKIAIAASIIIAISTIAYLVIPTKEGSQEPSIVSQPNDVKAPATNRAMITLADGTKVYLDSAANGTLAQQGNIKLIKLANGQIAYQTASGEEVREMQYNTLNNPNGSKVIDMQLEDGSHVWLNAGSSVTYPIAFIGNERKVTITGEAYFEIAKSVTASGAKQPFKVQLPSFGRAGGGEVTVLGTHFNINAYDDEADIKVTLLEGKVRVSPPGGGDLSDPNNLKRPGVDLDPGEQAVIAGGTNSPLTTHHSPDLDEVMAWKTGIFQFQNTDIQTLMRQIARWYDVQVIYDGPPITKKFGGKIPRTMSAINVFRVLEATGGVHFTIEDKKVTVRP